MASATYKPVPFSPVRVDAGDLLIIQRSGLFDVRWFSARNTDLVEAGIDTLAHYSRYGWREGRWPNAYFDPAWYLSRSRDVRETGREPLLHYIEHGEAEGRQPVSGSIPSGIAGPTPSRLDSFAWRTSWSTGAAA